VTSQSHPLTSAVEALTKELEQQMQQVTETKKMINLLKRRMGEEPPFPDSAETAVYAPDRPDLYYGKPFATAAQMFLERRGRACSGDDVLKGLESGGFDFDALGWKEKDRLRSLAMSLAKNTKVFHRLPNGYFGLLAWYPAVSEKKSKTEDAELGEAAADKKSGGEKAEKSE